MDQWLTFPWIETFTMSLIVIGGLVGMLLMFGKYPSGRWLGILTITYLGLVVAKQFAITILTPVFIVPASVTLFLYGYSFFFQKKRIKVIHMMPLVAIIGLTVVVYETSLIWTSAGLVAIAYVFNILKLMLEESKNRGFSYFLNPGARIVWFRNFVAYNIVFLGVSFVGVGGLGLAIFYLIFIAQILYQILNESSFFDPIPIGNKYKKSTLSPEIKSAILERLESVLDDKKFYRRDDASLSQLSKELGASTHHLSQVLNESLKISFQDLLARYRVREACRLLRDEQHNQLKIENIATKVGYNSKSAFNTAFKKRTGLTPSEYREAKDVRTYGEERLTERKAPPSSDATFSLNHVFNLKMTGDMILNFLKVFGRNIKRNRLFSTLNILGLTVGFTSSILIYLYIQDELSYDKLLPDSDRIYRIAWMNDNPQTRTPHPMAQAMVNDFPEIEEAVSFSPWYGPGLSKDLIRVENVERNIIFEEPDFYFADSTFFDVFQLELVEGDEDALKKPFSLVISESLARKYFGNSSAIGKELRLNQMPIAVSAVVKPMPENSHFHFNAFIPYVTLKQINPEDNWMTWADFGHFNYIKLKDGTDAADLEAKIPDWAAGYLNWDKSSLDRLRSGEIKFELQSIEDIHLTSHLRWELENNGNILYIYILSFTLAFLLLIAGINYVNLTTAKSVERAKEVGVRKTLGAVSGNLSLQFYLEAIIFCVIAMILSIVLSATLLGSFNYLSGKAFEWRDLLDSTFILRASLLCLFTGLMAGLYPAIVLSTYKPTDVLKGKLSKSSKGVRLRSVLVIVQFSISAVLISGSLIIFKQIQFMKETDLGFDQEAVISLNVPISVEIGGVDINALRTVQTQLKSVNGVKATALVSSTPGGQFNQHPYYLKDVPENRVDISSIMVDYDVDAVLQFEIAEGRVFDRSFAKDSLYNVLINESAARMLNSKDLIGKTLVQDASGQLFDFKIIGIVKDFHFQSLHQEIQPLIMSVQPLGAGSILVKLDGQQFGETINHIETIYNQNIDSDLPFEYEFLDQRLSKLYTQEEHTLSIFSVFALIALIVASLGLLGMAIAMLNQRIKEVGMRKILGATSSQIMVMILRQFALLILVSLAIGLPISYVLMQGWMQEFSYKVPFGVAPFAAAILVLLIISLISVFSAVIKITYSNPVDSLRYE